MTTDFAWMGAMGQSETLEYGCEIALAWLSAIKTISHPAGIVWPHKVLEP